MSSSATREFDSLALAQQIIDLNAEVQLEVEAGRYAQAASIRDRREALQRQLRDFGND